MTDTPQNLADKVTQKITSAVDPQKLAADAAKKALTNLTLTDEERAEQAQADAAGKRALLIKVILGGVVVLVVGVTILKIFAKLWGLVVITAIVGGVGGVAYLSLKPKLDAWKQKRLAAAAEKNAAKDAAAAATRVEEAKAAAQKKLDDDLARLKAKI